LPRRPSPRDVAAARTKHPAARRDAHAGLVDQEIKAVDDLPIPGTAARAVDSRIQSRGRTRRQEIATEVFRLFEKLVERKIGQKPKTSPVALIVDHIDPTGTSPKCSRKSGRRLRERDSEVELNRSSLI